MTSPHPPLSFYRKTDRERASTVITVDMPSFQRVYWKLWSERGGCARQLLIDAPVVTAGEVRVMIARQLRLVGAGGAGTTGRGPTAAEEEEEEAMEAAEEGYMFFFRERHWQRQQQQRRKWALQKRARDACRPCDFLELSLVTSPPSTSTMPQGGGGMSSETPAVPKTGSPPHLLILDDDNMQVPCSSVLVVRRLPPHCARARGQRPPPLLGASRGFFYVYDDEDDETARTSKKTRPTGVSTSIDAHTYAPGA